MKVLCPHCGKKMHCIESHDVTGERHEFHVKGQQSTYKCQCGHKEKAFSSLNRDLRKKFNTLEEWGEHHKQHNLSLSIKQHELKTNLNTGQLRREIIEIVSRLERLEKRLP